VAKVLRTQSSVVVVCTSFVLRSNEHAKGSRIDLNWKKQILSDVVSNNRQVIVLLQYVFSFNFNFFSSFSAVRNPKSLNLIGLSCAL